MSSMSLGTLWAFSRVICSKWPQFILWISKIESSNWKNKSPVQRFSAVLGQSSLILLNLQPTPLILLSICQSNESVQVEFNLTTLKSQQISSLQLKQKMLLTHGKSALKIM